MFTEKFDKYVCPLDTIECEHDGITITARIEPDFDYHIDDDDSHNPDQSVTGCDDEQQKRLLAARQAWFDDEWFYCGVVLAAEIDGIEVSNWHGLWGIEANYPGSDNSYLTEVANELLPEIIEAAPHDAAMMAAKLQKIKRG